MRFRKLAGLMVGGLALGALVAPGLASPAQAAAQTTTDFLSASCKYDNYYADYRSGYDVAVDGAAVTVTFADGFHPGATSPSFNTIQFKSITPTMVLDVDGQAVTVSGTQTYADVAYGAEGQVLGNTELAMPILAGTLTTADDDVDSVKLTSMTIPMKISPVTFAQNVQGTMTCTPDLVSTLDVTCSYTSFKMFYQAKAYTNIGGVTATTGRAPVITGTTLRSYLDNPLVAGMPNFLSVNSQAPTLLLDINGEERALVGTATYDPALTGDKALPMPKVTVTVPGTAALQPTDVSVVDFDTALNITAFGKASDNPIPCAAYEATTTTTPVSVTCAYGAFAMPVTSTLTTKYDGTNVTAKLSDITLSAMPPAFKINSISAAANVKAGTAPLALASPKTTFAPPMAANAPIPVPEMVGTTSTVLYPTATSLDLLSFSMNITAAPFSTTPTDADIKCGIPVATVTTLTGVSSSPNKATLTVKVDKADAAGSISFLEGTTEVGKGAVANGSLSVDLANVTAGAHTYTAKFVPTDATKFIGSTSAAVTVTVAAPVVIPPIVTPPAPSAACTTAQTELTKANAAVTSAQTKVTKTKAAVAKAKAKAKKAKAAAKKKATAKLKKASKKAKAAAKALKSAKTKSVSATNAVKAAC